MQTGRILTVKPHTTGTSARQVTMFCVNILSPFFYIGTNHVHFTRSRPRLACDLSEARMREDGHKARQQLLTNQTVSILQHKELGQVYEGGLRSKVYPPQTSLRFLQVNSAASTALRAAFSTHEKAATPRESPL